jgi:dTDP-glucose pyrophosphorylase
MRCLIYAKTKDTAWLRDYFPDIEPYLLKIVNKPLLEYAMDFASLLGVNELRIVTDSSTKDIEAFFGTGAKWG